MSGRYLVRATRSDGIVRKNGAFRHRDSACERARWLVGDSVAQTRREYGQPPYIAAIVVQDGFVLDRFPAPIGEIPRFKA